jgi:hypothetical protein
MKKDRLRAVFFTVIGNGKLFHVEQFEIASNDAP